MALQFACTRLIEPDELTCDCDTEGLSNEDFDEIVDAASDILVLITGLRLGRCEQVLRPCQRYMTCGGACGCCELTGVPVPGPDPDVVEVVIDGDTVDPNTYALITAPGGERILERFKLDGKRDYWPGCQRVELPSTMEDTFEVTVENGLLINTLIRNAAAEIACDLAAAATGGESKLPDGTVAMSVYGIQIDRRRFNPGDVGGEQLEGLSWTQRVISVYPRVGLSNVWSPELAGANWVSYQR